ncbi:hypothetical protein CRE_14621 [Caenorhabditis remanei]|uniref:SCP domain-containing protein n=1 Tax=Caenorhabditis remanei TaxID=31234 RepID=E3M946_CAERE|nr:hypothetical protein CRE_14621 [Caenorhabditis remanei]
MNLFQSLVIFLSFVAIKDVASMDREDFISDINVLRRDYANRFKVPNMHELIWSWGLFNILIPLEWGVPWPEARKTWRYLRLESYEGANTSTKNAAEKYFSNPYNRTDSYNELEFLNPIQRFYACIGRSEWIREELRGYCVCLVGTEGEFTIFDTSGNSKKVPGSECHKRYKNDNGLCVPNNKTEEWYDGHPQDILEDINQIRKVYSEKYNVPNMHQLIWSDDLLKNLQKMIWSNRFQDACVTWRYVHLDNYIKTSIESELDTFFNKIPLEKRLFIRNGSDTTLRSLEFLNPLQKFIACGRKTNSLIMVCLFGTEGKFTMFDYSNKSSEIPGSNCHKGYRNDSGVCVAIKPEEESYFGRQLDFMSDINQIRRRYAKEYRVPNMHELTWSNDLAEVLEHLHMTGVRAQAKKTWRYGAINTYDNIIYQIEKGVTFFFESNRTAKKIHIESLSKKDTMDRLEFLNPLQKTIACGRKEEEGGYRRGIYIICLLGPEGNFTIFDTTFQWQASAGSKCDKGYYNEDGLCIVQIPTQEPIIDYRKMAEEEKNKALTEEPEPEPLLENHGNGISLGYLLAFLLAKLLFNI